jgi:PLP dependent protein
MELFVCKIGYFANNIRIIPFFYKMILQKIQTDLLPFGARLVAVSKTQPIAALEALYAQGQRLFGENRVQELLGKQAVLPSDIEWHIIGHLQSNKVRQIAPFVSMIHSVDSLKLLQVIDNEAVRGGRTIECLLQFHIAEEETKFGFSESEASEMLQSDAFILLKNVKIRGVMGMASFSENKEQVRAEFRSLRAIFERLKVDFFEKNVDFNEISMGMSGDYPIALEEGATLVRVGSLLFR